MSARDQVDLPRTMVRVQRMRRRTSGDREACASSGAISTSATASTTSSSASRNATLDGEVVMAVALCSMKIVMTLADGKQQDLLLSAGDAEEWMRRFGAMGTSA